MGLSDRDYVRDEHKKRNSPIGLPSGNSLGPVPNLTFGIVAAVVLAAIFITYASLNSGRPKKSENTKPVDVAHERLSQISPVNINTASYEDLRLIPGVSHKVAEGIISSRPFDSIERLDDVYGIGPKTLELIRPHVSVDSP